jgi:hypothetical protein
VRFSCAVTNDTQAQRAFFVLAFFSLVMPDCSSKWCKNFGLYHTKPTTRVEKAAVKSAKKLISIELVIISKSNLQINILNVKV